MKLKRVRLGDVFSIKQGFAFKSSNYVNRSNYRLVTLGNFANDNSFKFNNDKAKYYKGNFPNDVELKEMDLILPLTEQVEGLLGNSAFVPNVNNKHFNFVLNQRVGKIICNDKKIDKKFLHYLLSTNLIKDQMEAFAHGTRQRNISPEEIYKIEAYIPTISVQSKIGNFLYSIERKIDNNNKICKELESMAKTIYDYWFLQFEFPDKDGKPYKSNGGKMIWNDQLKQEIPEGWEVNKLKSILAENPKSHIKVNEASQIGEIPFFTSGENILFVNSPSVSGLNCYLNTGGNAGVKCFLGDASYSTDTWSVTSNSEMKYLLPFILKSLQPSMDRNFFQGTGLKHLQKNLLRDFLIVVPNTKIIDKFKVIINDSFKHESHIYIENKELNSIRDFLLPLLMNGQVTIEG